MADAWCVSARQYAATVERERVPARAPVAVGTAAAGADQSAGVGSGAAGVAPFVAGARVARRRGARHVVVQPSRERYDRLGRAAQARSLDDRPSAAAGIARRGRHGSGVGACRERCMTITLRPLAEQTIVITGASSGIGLVTALEAARRGARVVVAARNEHDLAAAVAEVRRRGGRAIYQVTDMADE